MKFEIYRAPIMMGFKKKPVTYFLQLGASVDENGKIWASRLPFVDCATKKKQKAQFHKKKSKHDLHKIKRKISREKKPKHMFVYRLCRCLVILLQHFL